MVETIPFMQFQAPRVAKKKGGGFLGGLFKPLASIAGAAIGFVTGGGPAGAVAGFKIGQAAGDVIGGIAEGDPGAAISGALGTAVGELVDKKAADIDTKVTQKVAQVAGDVPISDIDKRIGEAYGLLQGAPTLGQYIYGGWGQPTYGIRPRRQ